MSKTTTTVVNFSAIDFKGQNSLSSYALSNIHLKFVPNTPKTVNSRLVWDFGDGTKSKSFSPSKSWTYPGEYVVSLVVYDCNNNAQISTFNKKIEVVDYVPYTFTIKEALSTQSINSLFKAGQISQIGDIVATYPPYQPTSNIFYSVSGSTSKDYHTICHKKFAHLEKFYSFYQKRYNHAIKSFQYEEVDKFEMESSLLYAKISNNSIIRCSESDEGSFIVGLSATKPIFFKDDTVNDQILIDFYFDKNNTYIPIEREGFTRTNYLNNLSVTLSAKVVDNDEQKSLVISSNGMDGEGYGITSFNINPVKYFNTKIPFVVRIKDVYGFSVKNFSTLSLSAINLEIIGDHPKEILTEGGTSISTEDQIPISGTIPDTIIPSNKYQIYSIDDTQYPGSFRGYIKFVNSSIPISNVRIVANTNIINDQTVTHPLSGSSSQFSVFPSNYIDLFKIHENFDASSTLSDLRFQEIMLDKNIFFQEFIGSALGNSDSLHDSIGKKSYEKISNFVANTQDLNVCEIPHIRAMGAFMGYDGRGQSNYFYPERIQYLLNLASLDKAALLGNTNKFRENFDIRGRSSKETFGRNIGDVIDINSYIINPNKPIVALEKFSNVYMLLNTEQPGLSNYTLSSYSPDWGWPLVLPTNFVFEDFSKYYIFFEYVDEYDGTPVGGIIDFENPLTTIDSNSNNSLLFGSGGIFESKFSDILYQSLSIVES